MEKTDRSATGGGKEAGKHWEVMDRGTGLNYPAEITSPFTWLSNTTFDARILGSSLSLSKNIHDVQQAASLLDVSHPVYGPSVPSSVRNTDVTLADCNGGALQWTWGSL